MGLILVFATVLYRRGLYFGILRQDTGQALCALLRRLSNMAAARKSGRHPVGSRTRAAGYTRPSGWPKHPLARRAAELRRLMRSPKEAEVQWELANDHAV
jgi:hypothetical protein